MKISDTREDDGYRGLVRNPDTGQVLYASRSMAMNRNLERIDSLDQRPAVKTSKPVQLVETIVDSRTPAPEEADVVEESTPEEEVSTEAEAGEFALVTVLAEAGATDDKAVLKELGAGIGVKLTLAMNPATMKERIEKQVKDIRYASKGA